MHRQSEPRAGNHQRHTRTRNVSLPTQANHTVRGARKQPPKWGATHAASEVRWCGAPQRPSWDVYRQPGRRHADSLGTGSKVLMVHCSGFGLPMHARLLRLFVKNIKGVDARRDMRRKGGGGTKRRSSWACIGNPKPEQETIEGTHAQETPAYQHRPTTHCTRCKEATTQSGRRGVANVLLKASVTSCVLYAGV